MSTILQTTFGQIEKPFKKGYILTGGSFSISYERENDLKRGVSPYPDVTYTTNTKSIESDLFIGYFLINHLTLGLKTELFFSNYKTTYSLGSSILWDNTETDLLIGPFVRYYTKTGLFFEGYAGIGSLKYVISNDKSNWRVYSWSTGVGYSLFLSKAVAIEPEIKFSQLSKNQSKIEAGEEILNSKLSFSVGFQIYINMKSEQKENH